MGNVPLDALADIVVSDLAVNPLVDTVAQTFALSHGLPTAAGVVVAVTMMVSVAVAQALIMDPVAQSFDPSVALNLVQAINASVAQTGMEPIAQAGREPIVQGTVEFANMSLEERAQLPVAEALDNSSAVSSARDHSYSL